MLLRLTLRRIALSILQLEMEEVSQVLFLQGPKRFRAARLDGGLHHGLKLGVAELLKVLQSTKALLEPLEVRFLVIEFEDLAKFNFRLNVVI